MGAYHDVSDLPKTTDFLVIGAGIVGLSLALELRERYTDCSICVIDKEQSLATHASGRNSGVLHAGFYYSADSLKARLCREGNVLMQAWCEEHDVPLRRCGKLVVARDDNELAGLDELKRRADQNGVPIEMVDARAAKQIEPRARTHERALLSPSTGSVDPKQVMLELGRQAQRRRITLCLDTAWMARSHEGEHTSRGTIRAGYVVNAAGLQAVRIAQHFGLAEGLAMVPFKGKYLYADDDATPLRVHIYPVPDLELPFLGVHFTVTVDGHVKIGPTAGPAWWFENYGATDPDVASGRFAWGELGSIVREHMRLFFMQPRFRRHALREPRRSFRGALLEEARQLVPDIDRSKFTRWGRSGLRAQLVDQNQAELVMDFRYETTERSMHIVNAVSPGFTCAWSFAKLLADAIENPAGSKAPGSQDG